MEPLNPYLFSGKSSASGILTLIGVSLLGAAIVGALYWKLTNFLDIPVLMPALAGLLVAFIVKWGAALGKCRSMPAIVTAAILAGMLTYGVRLALDSQQTRPAMVRAVSRRIAQHRGLPASAARSVAERRLTPWVTLRLFLRVQAAYGVTLTNSSSHSYSVSSPSGTQSVGGGGGMILSGVWYWLLLLAEAGAAGAVAASVAARYGLVEPFCEPCKRWMPGTKVVKVAPRQAGELIQCIQSQEWDNLLKVKPNGTVDAQNYASATVYRCPECRSGTVSVFAQVGNTAKRLLHVKIGPKISASLCDNPVKKLGFSRNNLPGSSD